MYKSYKNISHLNRYNFRTINDAQTMIKIYSVCFLTWLKSNMCWHLGRHPRLRWESLQHSPLPPSWAGTVPVPYSLPPPPPPPPLSTPYNNAALPVVMKCIRFVHLSRVWNNLIKAQQISNFTSMLHGML